jgi:tetratricopeptide (TPR) repeat protein
MAIEPTTVTLARPPLQAAQVYGMAVLFLAMGLAIGYLLRGSQSAVFPPQAAANAAPASTRGRMTGSGPVPGVEERPRAANNPSQPPANAAPSSNLRGAMNASRMPSLEQMEQMADKQAEPLLEKLKSDPNNSSALIQLGAIYHTTHRFKEAAACYSKAVEADPKNVAVRIRLASSLYRSGNVDAAIAQLNKALSYDPKDANALFDLGMIRLQGKQDGKGAVAAWQHLLKTNPQLSADRKAQVQKLMADVLTTLGDQDRIEGATGK